MLNVSSPSLGSCLVLLLACVFLSALLNGSPLVNNHVLFHISLCPLFTNSYSLLGHTVTGGVAMCKSSSQQQEKVYPHRILCTCCKDHWLNTSLQW